MEGIQSYGGQWLDASSRWAADQESFDRQVASGMVGRSESVSLAVTAPSLEPTATMLEQLVGSTRQLFISLIKELRGYQELKGRERANCLDPSVMKAFVDKNSPGSEAICAAFELKLRQDEMRSMVQGQMGSLVAA